MRHTEGVSILSAVKDRTEALIGSLPSWLDSGADQIVIVDYSSEPSVAGSLEKAGISDPRIQICRIDGKSSWWLADAFNSGIDLVKNSRVLKLDADHVISPDLLARVDLGKREFFTGHWSNPLPGQSHTNGAIFLHTAHLRSVGGWDPRITTYGWDDSDLYERLTYFGLRRYLFPSGFIKHRNHADSQRIEIKGSVGVPTGVILRGYTYANQVMTRALMPWRGFGVTDESEIPTPTESDPFEPGIARYKRNAISVSAFGRKIAEVASESNSEDRSLRAKKAKIFAQLESVYWRYLASKSNPNSPDFDPPVHWKPRRTSELILQVQFGLGNRLRALAAGFQYAQRTGAKLVLVWLPDAHCEARFSDLFRWAGEVIEDEALLLERLKASRHKFFDWSIELPLFDEMVARRSKKNLFIKSSKMFLMDSPDSRRIAKRFLQNLIPVETVQHLIASVPKDFEAAFHIRQIGGPAFEHLAYEPESNWGKKAQQEIGERRGRVKTEAFELLVTYLAENSDSKIAPPVFVAADHLPTKQRILDLLGASARWLPSRPESRGAIEVQEALAEMYLVSRAPLFIGSTYSSFSEVANYLSSSGQTYERVGESFL